MWKWSTRDAHIFTAKTSSGKCLCFRKDLIHAGSGWILYLQPEPQNDSITALTCTLRYSMSQVSVECLCKAYWPTTLSVAAPLVAGWRNFGVRCTAATMPALPASPLCQWASGFVLGNFVVVTWSPTSSPFAAAWSSWLQGEEKGRITGPIGEPGGISDSSRGAAGEYGTNIVRI